MGVTKTAPSLTGGRLLARSTIWNMIGQVLPMAVGVAAVPPLVRLLGVDRFGLLSLAWIIVGYFSLFDLGMGRALTKLVADKLGANDEKNIPPLVWTSLFLLLSLGVVGGLVTWAISPWLVHSALKIPQALQAETLLSFELLAASIPIVTVTSGLRGILEAQQRFGVLSFIRVPTSAFSFVGPLLVLPFSRSLVPVIIILIVGRVIGCVAHLVACLRAMPALRHNFVLRRADVLPLARFGGWMTVSNVVGPIMGSMDRFLISGLLSVSAVAYYTAPFDVLSRFTFIPWSVGSVLFPALAVSLVQDPDRTELLARRGVKYIFLAMFPIILITITFAPEGLRLWLGPAFAHNSESVLRLLAVGVFVNALSYVPFALIQSAGRPHVTATLHLVELPLYLVAVWMLTKRLGIEGTAIAWTGRVMLDAILLFFLADRVLPHKSKFLLKLTVTMAVALMVLCVSVYLRTPLSKTAFVLPALLVYGLVGFWGMAPEERLMFRSRGARSIGIQGSRL
jgi:O-antigen/teichoic acid export membrane protein